MSEAENPRAVAGDNSNRKKPRQGGPISADRLKSMVERIEKLTEEKDGIAEDIKDIYSEAKGVGYDVKTIRRIVALRKMDAADRAEAATLLETYAHALGLEGAFG